MLFQNSYREEKNSTTEHKDMSKKVFSIIELGRILIIAYFALFSQNNAKYDAIRKIHNKVREKDLKTRRICHAVSLLLRRIDLQHPP